jgi:hypothetical protein
LGKIILVIPVKGFDNYYSDLCGGRIIEDNQFGFQPADFIRTENIRKIIDQPGWHGPFRNNLGEKWESP